MDKKLKRTLLAEVAGVTNDITSPAMGGVFRQFDTTLTDKGAGNIHLYDSVQRDAHAYCLLEKRVNAYAMKPWVLVRADDATAYDKKFAKFADGVLRKMNITRIRKESGIAKMLFGYAPGEVMWKREGQFTVATDIINRDPMRFLVDENGGTRLRTWKNMFPGELMPDRKILWYTFDKRNNNPYGRGLGAILWWMVFFKREQQRQLVTYSGKFASPTVVATFKGTGNDSVQEDAQKAAEGVSGESEVAVSENVVLSLLESTRQGSEMVFVNGIKLWNEEMSKAVLGLSQATGEGSKSAASSVQDEDERSEFAQGDADAADREMAELLTWLRDLNFPGAKIPQFSTRLAKPNDRKKTAETDAILFSTGWIRDDESQKATYGAGYVRAPKAEAIDTPAKTPTAAGAAQVNVNAAHA